MKWDTWQALVQCEVDQSLSEGREPAAVEAWRRSVIAAPDTAAITDAWAAVRNLPLAAGWPHDEPSDLAAILARRQEPPPQRVVKEWSPAELYDRLHGAWLGRCCGCALGKPVEPWWIGSREVAGRPIYSRERIRRYLEALGPGEYPLRDYFPADPQALQRVGETLACPDSQRGRIAYMESDDDIRYLVLGQILLQQHGASFTTWDVARAWMRYLPYDQVYTAERQAYRNLVRRYNMALDWPVEGVVADCDWCWVAHDQNPFREWIGAQIRVDAYGYAMPGRPERAAELAWRDARLSHTRNGIYGAMFCAAMVAAAFVEEDPAAVVETGLAAIPATSRLHAEMRAVVDACRRHGAEPAGFEAVLDKVWAKLGHYPGIHTNNNAGLVVAALLLGQGDFEKTLSIAVMGGWDTDCNGATAGSIAGAMLGASRLPSKWTAPLRDTLHSQIAGYHPIAISECAQRSVAIAQRMLAE